MRSALRTLLTQWFQPPPSVVATPPSPVGRGAGGEEAMCVPYDENLLEKSRTQWQFGDWESLAGLERETLQHHPDRAELILLAAAGRLQNGENAESCSRIRLPRGTETGHIVDRNW